MRDEKAKIPEGSSIRHEGKVYTPGMEAELAKASGGSVMAGGFGGPGEEGELQQRHVQDAEKVKEEREAWGIGADEPGTSRKAKAGAEDEDETVAVSELSSRLASMNDVDEIKRMKRADKRATAKAHYDRRLEELKET